VAETNEEVFSERIEELEADLLLMMRSRKVLYEGMGKVLAACGNYTDSRERGGGEYSLAMAMQDVMDASREAFVAHMRIMTDAAKDNGWEPVLGVTNA
jgi:hypothetical protein